MMKMSVTTHFMKYGPIGVPNGFVETQNLVNGSTPCLIAAKLVHTLVNDAFGCSTAGI